MTKILIILSLLGLVACESTPPSLQSGPDAETTFDGLVRVDNAKLGIVWVKPGINLKSYNKIMLASGGIKYRAARTRHSEFPLTEAQKEKIRTNVRAVFIDELIQMKHFKLTDEPGPDTLKLSGMLIDVVSKIPPEPVGRVDYYLAEIGQATLILQLSDSDSDEALVRAADRQSIGNEVIGMRSNPVTNRAELRREIRKWGVILRNGLDSLYETGSL